MPLTLLIQGASIAGPALAYWLARDGHDVTVVERAPAIRTGGYKIDVRGPACDVLRGMGLYDAAHGQHVGMRRATFVDAAGRPLASLDADTFGMREPGDIELMRGDLARILYEATRDRVRYVFSDSVAAIDQVGREVDVRLHGGTRRRFDAVIGADGLHSSLRALVFGAEQAFLRHLGMYVAIGSVPNELGLEHEEVAYLAPHRLVNVYSADRSGDAKALFLFRASGPDVRHDDTGAQRRLLRQAMLADLGAAQRWRIPELLARMDEAPDFYFDSISQVVMPQWAHGRVGLIGDAAYCASPASGQGVSLALVGARILAQELGRADAPEAFRACHARMHGFVLRNQQLAEEFRSLLPTSPRGAWAQRLALRLMRFAPVRSLAFGPQQRRYRQAISGIDLLGAPSPARPASGDA